MKKILLLSVTVLMMFAGMPLCAQKDTDTWGRDFADGLFIRGMYDSAIKEYQRLLDSEVVAEERQEIEFRIAEAYFKRKSLAEAMTHFTAYRDRYDDNTRAHAQLYVAFIYVEQNDGAKAYDAFAQVATADLSPNQQPMYFYYYALAAKEQKKYEEAITLFGKVVDTDTVQLRALALKETAACYKELGDFDAANQTLERLINDYPDRNGVGEVYLMLGRNFFEKGNFAESLAYFEQAQEKGVLEESRALLGYGMVKNLFQLNRMADVVAQIEQFSEDVFDPSIWDEIQYLYASALFQEKQHDASRAVIDALITRAREQKIVPPEHIIMQGLWVAYELKDDARIAEYASLLDLQYSESLGRAEAYFLRAERLFDRGKYHEAEEAYAQVSVHNAVFRYRDYAEYKRALSLKKREQYDLALEVFTGILAEFPQSTYRESVFLECIDLAEIVQDYQSGQSFCEQFIKEFPVATVVEEVYMKKAQCEYAQDAFDAMHDTLVALLEAYPDTQKKREVLYNLGRYFERTERYEEAILRYKNAQEATSVGVITDAELAVRLGVAYYFTTRYADAKTVLMQVYSSEGPEYIPDDILFWLSDYSGEQGDYAVAISVSTTLLARELQTDMRERILYKVADWYREQEAWEDARVRYEQFAEEFPGSELDIFVKLGLAMCDEALGESARAKELYAGLVTSDVPYVKARAYQGLGNICYAEGDLEEAVRSYMFVTILFDDPIVPYLMVKSAEIWIELGSVADAQAVLNDFTARFPEHELTEKVFALLATTTETGLEE